MLAANHSIKVGHFFVILRRHLTSIPKAFDINSQGKLHFTSDVVGDYMGPTCVVGVHCQCLLTPKERAYPCTCSVSLPLAAQIKLVSGNAYHALNIDA